MVVSTGYHQADVCDSLSLILVTYPVGHGVFCSTAIDLVIGGPPCVDYSAVNARREGSEGDQGQFMIHFGSLIRRMERLQQVEFDGHRLFFLAENVVFRGDDLETVRSAYGMDWDPIDFDAKYVSP